MLRNHAGLQGFVDDNTLVGDLEKVLAHFDTPLELRHDIR